MGFRSGPIEQVDWFEQYEHSRCLNHQPINLDVLEGVIRNPIQQVQVVGRVLRGSVCSLRLYSYRNTTGALVYTLITLLRKEEVFCSKVEARTGQRKGAGE